ncbi:MAG: hypothetical protein AB7O59_03570 [Pirellulales bacterium]
MNDEAVLGAIDSVLATAHFFVPPPGRLRIEQTPRQEVAWEVFRGHLLDAAHSSATRTFQSWRVFVDAGGTPSEAPLVLLYWDERRQEICVVRQILVYGHEAYESSPGVIDSRPAEKWAREWVGTMDLRRFDEAGLVRELCTYLWLAVVGTSRLPITSLESPLPAFSLGQLAYLPGVCRTEHDCWRDPTVMLADVLRAESPLRVAATALEVALRAVDDAQVPQVAAVLVSATGGAKSHSPSALLRELFNNVALSPYTGFVGRLVQLLEHLAAEVAVGPVAVVDLIASMLVPLCRHLTAFDLTTFHNFGANYPDALFLDALLKTYLRLVDEHANLWLDEEGEAQPSAAARRLRRRACRQACLVRQHYEGHRVPDAPTSQGESQRVLPPSFARVAEEQIVQPGKRRKTLFAGDPLAPLLTPQARVVLDASIADLAHAVELSELGTATFLDRPLGIARQAGEVDRTPLVSYVTISRSIIVRRLAELERAGWLPTDSHVRRMGAVAALALPGVPIAGLELTQRPGVVSLADARQAAPDFVVVRSTRRSLEGVMCHYDPASIRAICREYFADVDFTNCVLVGRSSPTDSASHPPMLAIYDARHCLRAEFMVGDGAAGSTCYVERGGVEVPIALQLWRVWRGTDKETTLVEHDVRGRGIVLRPLG